MGKRILYYQKGKRRMKRKKLWLKLLLDLVMLIVFSLLLWKNNFGIAFHEIAGLAILTVFLLHILLNWRWVCQVTKHFFSKNMTPLVRIEWILNVALVICFLCIGVSGALMSRVVFHFSVGGNWKTLHYFCSALALIFVGIHLGLHLTMIGKVLHQRLHLPLVVERILLTCFLLAVVVTGIYSLTSTSFSMWLRMPFSTEASMKNGEHAGMEHGRGEMRQNGSAPADSSPADSSEEELPKFDGQTKEKGGYGKRNRNGTTGEKQAGSSMTMVIWKAVQYISITLLFAVVTWFIERLLQRRKKRNK